MLFLFNLSNEANAVDSLQKPIVLLSACPMNQTSSIAPVYISIICCLFNLCPVTQVIIDSSFLSQSEVYGNDFEDNGVGSIKDMVHPQGIICGNTCSGDSEVREQG